MIVAMSRFRVLHRRELDVRQAFALLGEPISIAGEAAAGANGTLKGGPAE